jgi:predicted nucleic acid-binding protein
LNRWVVDASVGAKWVLPEIHADAARRLLSGDHFLLVPDLFFLEIANVLWKRVRSGQDTEENARAALLGFDLITLEVHSSRDLAVSALEIACREQRTAYDGVYLALAIREGIRLVTADQRFYNAITSGSLAAHICWVEDVG